MTDTASTIAAHTDDAWDQIVPVLEEYIAIPNVSMVFDPEWREHGHMAAAVDLIAGWCRARTIPGLTVEVVELDGRSPVILIEVPAVGTGSDTDTVLLYGHLDKQPEMEGWRDGLGPWTPVIEGDRLYGRGGADDGYSAFAALTAISASTEIWSFGRSGMCGRMTFGSITPSLSITKRDLMPEAFSIKPTLDSPKASISPRSIAALLSALNCWT